MGIESWLSAYSRTSLKFNILREAAFITPIFQSEASLESPEDRGLRAGESNPQSLHHTKTDGNGEGMLDGPEAHKINHRGNIRLPHIVKEKTLKR